MEPPVDSLTRLGHERDALLERITARLRADPRVAAVWLSGSFGRDEADEWSDLDLHVAVDDATFERFLDERPQLYAAVGRPLLIQPEMLQSDSQPGARFQLVIYDGPVEVDWNIGPATPAERPAASILLVDRTNIPVQAPPPLTPEQRRHRAHDRLIFFWAMAPIAVKLAGRGETRRAAAQITLMTNAYISLWRLAHQPDGPEPYLPSTNRPIEPELDLTLPALGPLINPMIALEVIDALCDKVERLHPTLATLGIPPPTDMPLAIKQIGAIAEDAIRPGHFPRRKFR